MAASVSAANGLGSRRNFPEFISWRSGRLRSALTFTGRHFLWPGSHRDLLLSHFQPPATGTGLQFLDTEGPAASGRREVVAGPRRTLCFWLQLVETCSTCFPVFIELRAWNAACGHGGWPDGAWLPGSAQISAS